MADWKIIAKAARNTARKQASEAKAGAGVYTQAARNTAARQAPEVQRSLKESGARARRTTAAYGAVAGTRIRRARLGTRLKNALRDALLMGGSVAIIWFVVTRTGVAIPPSILIGVIVVLMVARFGYALFARQDTTVDDVNAWEDERSPEDDPADRSFDPRGTAAAEEPVRSRPSTRRRDRD